MSEDKLIIARLTAVACTRPLTGFERAVLVALLFGTDRVEVTCA